MPCGAAGRNLENVAALSNIATDNTGIKASGRTYAGLETPRKP